MKVLHVTTWYPNDLNPHEALWIQRHIESLGPYIQEYLVLHLEVKSSSKFRFTKGRIAYGIRRRLELPLRSWFVIELMTALLLVYYLLRYQRKKYDVVNFHIAYPSLVYWHLLKQWFKVPVVITEHWSAYHFNFGVPIHRQLSRIKRIFHQNIPVIAVSKALANDLKNFSKADFPFRVVPNVVDETIFYAERSVQRNDSFFMISQWKWPKKPLVIFESFKQFIEAHHGFKLKVAGYGADYPEMVTWIQANGMEDSILLLGSLSPSEVATCLRTCRAFVHCTEYETFSVVCAEAVSCGTPVLASKVGGIREVVHDGEGLLLDSHDISAWTLGMRAILEVKFISSGDHFTKSKVGGRYYAALSSLAEPSV